ncbi:MAG: hypothetical protein K8U57_39705, partial [Planctomycetes bacterium]|nr:hypothetical protein [Planctomycetota bacterium]
MRERRPADTLTSFPWLLVSVACTSSISRLQDPSRFVCKVPARRITYFESATDLAAGRGSAGSTHVPVVKVYPAVATAIDVLRVR